MKIGNMGDFFHYKITLVLPETNLLIQIYIYGLDIERSCEFSWVLVAVVETDDDVAFEVFTKIFRYFRSVGSCDLASLLCLDGSSPSAKRLS